MPSSSENPAAPTGPSAPPGFQGLLERIRDPSTPLALKMSAARGVLPLPPGQMLQVLVALLQEPLQGLAQVAARTLQEHAADPQRLANILEEKDTDPAVLAYFGKQMARSSEIEVLRIVVAHPNTPVNTLKSLAANQEGEVLEAILLNEDRLIQVPGILEVLQSNPRTTPRQKTRIEEIEQHLIRGNIAATPQADEPEPAGPGASGPDVAVADPETIEEPTETLPQDLAAAADEEVEEEIEGQALEKIQALTVPEKIQLAITANREERMILVRDTNKQVATAVVKSPKVTDKDVESFAGMRNVQEEVLRIIGGKREWVKHYPVAHALVQNPRTPSGIALGLLSRINTRDLKTLMANRNIPELIRRTARKYWQARTAPPKRVGKKK